MLKHRFIRQLSQCMQYNQKIFYNKENRISKSFIQQLLFRKKWKLLVSREVLKEYERTHVSKT